MDMKKGSLFTFSLVCLRTLNATRFDSFRWVMTKFMYVQMTNKNFGIFYAFNYEALNVMKWTPLITKDGISIHAYVMQNWVKLPMMISLQVIVYGARVDNLTIVIMEALQNGEGLSSTIIIKKLLCFGANGVSTFKGIKTRVIKQINTIYASFSIGVHYMAHKRNLVFKTLSTLGIINNIELINFTNMMETKRL